MPNAEELLQAALSAPDKGDTDLKELLGSISTLRAKNYSWREISAWFADKAIDVDHARLYRAFTKHLAAVINVPEADRYAKALRGLKMTAAQKAMLKFHFGAPNRTVTYTELAKAAGKTDYRVANTEYGNLGAAIGKATGFEFPMAPKRGKPFYSGAIGIDAPRGPSNEYRLMMHHSLADAIQTLKLFD
jgi:hypothetical protein